jgi:hypothetical protein
VLQFTPTFGGGSNVSCVGDNGSADLALDDVFASVDFGDISALLSPEIHDQKSPEKPDPDLLPDKLDYDPDPETPATIQQAMYEAGPNTSKVDDYMYKKLNAVALYHVVYFSKEQRTIHVPEDPEMSRFTCNIGCSNIRSKDGSFKMARQQGCQGVYDHCVSRGHCNKLVPIGKDQTEWYSENVVARVERRVGSVKWKLKGQDTVTKRRVKPKGNDTNLEVASIATNDFWTHPDSVANNFLNGLTAPGVSDPLALQAESTISQGILLGRTRTR